LFAIFIDGIAQKAADSNIFKYTDDIILIAPAVAGLQCLLNVCESELVKLGMCINVVKSMEFAITRLFMKISETGSPTIIIECHEASFYFLIDVFSS